LTWGDGGVATLTYDATGAVAAIFPSKVGKAKIPLTINGTSGSVSICGATVAVAAVGSPKLGIALDANGDGKIDPGEYKAVVNDTVAFELELPIDGVKKKVGIVLGNVKEVSNDKGNAIVTAEVYPAGCWKSAVGGTAVKIIDENMDGVITQDGKDSILIGISNFAVPLLTMHEVNGVNYEIKIDGLKLTSTPVKDVELGAVETGFKTPPAALILQDVKDGRAYDIKTSVKGIPAGDYQLSYGVVAAGPNGSKPLLFSAGPKPTIYTITAGKLNKLRIGDMKVDFRGSFAADKSQLDMPASQVSVVGAGGEVYDFKHYGRMPEPKAQVTDGNKVLASTGSFYY
jgi:hypothetical protein